ncbi:MAG: aromatic amino acid hydroxylase, partial [Pseudomonadota bacterium]
KIPQHLHKYIVEQDYDTYTSEDQEVWRFVMRQLQSFLTQNAHEAYEPGLLDTGISVNEIPRISVMDQKLKAFGWRAVAVSGFIPPAAFMEFQSNGILPIACDMRSVENILYTPAPDIVHEAAGHAPILIDPEFSKYLKSYAEVASRSIISSEDLDLYEAIRKLSDIKESNQSSEHDIKKAEDELNYAVASMTYVSEAQLLGRMNWWTAEYGLVGSMDAPKIYGAGLLSSVGEAKTCLEHSVKKIPLSVDCIEMTYDITEKQPQLFVTPKFDHLHTVLDQLADKLAYRLGGTEAIERAMAAETVNTVELETGLQMSGIVDRVDLDSKGDVCFFHMSGRSQISRGREQLDGHGPDYHSHGYSTPIGPIEGFNKPLSSLSQSEQDSLNIKVGAEISLNFTSGIKVKGRLKGFSRHEDRLDILSFENCTVSKGDEFMFQPDWGVFDLACGGQITSVYAGPADRLVFEVEEDFVASRVPSRTTSPKEQQLYGVFQKIRGLQGQENIIEEDFDSLVKEWSSNTDKNWLAGLELYEIALQRKIEGANVNEIAKSFEAIKDPSVKTCLEDGLDLVKSEIN